MATLAQSKVDPVGAEPWLTVDLGEPLLTVHVGGEWIMARSGTLEALCASVRPGVQTKAAIDLSRLDRMDTVGAYLLIRLRARLRGFQLDADFTGVSDQHDRLIEQVRANDVSCMVAMPEKNSFIRLTEEIGVGTVNVLTSFGSFLSFLGLVLIRLFGALIRPDRLRTNALVSQMEYVGLKAMPIVGLISLLIGAVIVNQGAVQLRQFGAEVLVVNMVSIAVLRELGILLTSIIVAGRSGSAFTAQIGSMVMREEVDAMRTLGLNPIDVLVLPRLIAMMLMLPLLTFFADLMGLLGGMLMAWATLDIGPSAFINQLHAAVTMKSFLVGVIKAPVFAIIISISGCFQGLAVSGTSDSVGRNTTASVVQSIFLVIVLDALFAIFFTVIGWAF